MPSKYVEKRTRLMVWYLKPDAEGFYLIVRRIEKKRFRIELQSGNYIPDCTATVSSNEITDINTSAWNRKKGHAKRLIKLAKTAVFPNLTVSAPSTWRGMHLYNTLVADFEDMKNEEYEKVRTVKEKDFRESEQQYRDLPYYDETS